MQRLQRFQVALSAFALGIAFAGASSCGGESPSAVTVAERIFVVETAEALAEDIRVTVDAVGTAQASEEAQIRPQVDGVIAEILFQEGGEVERDALLIRLDDRKAQANLKLAQAALDSSKAKQRLSKQRLTRHQSLISEKLISDEAFESIEAAYEEAEASVREEAAAVTLAERELDDYYLRAPFSGTVGERLVDVGNYVESGTMLTVLLQTNPLQIAFRAPDRHAGRIGVGTRVTITPSGGGEAVEGVTDFIDPRIDPSTRMLSLRASVDNSDGQLLHGQFVQVSILIGERNGQVVVPEEAILSASGNNWVFVVNDGIAVRRDVTLGERRPTKVEILEGINVGDTIVVGGQHRLHNGVRVKSVATEEGNDSSKGG